jgi:hypothetical protein
VAQLQADLCAALAVHKVDDARERRLLRVVPQPRAAGRDAAFGCRAGHLHHHQRRAAQRARAQVHQMEVLHHAIDRAVGGHGRDDDAVLELHVHAPAAQQHRRHG